MIETEQFDYTVTFACFNQSEYTRKCLLSLIESGVDPNRIVAIDNASTDDTTTVIGDFPGVRLIKNKSNLGCGTAWNQGALEFQSEWTVVMNNDILVVNGWLEGLYKSAKKHALKVICPAMIEGSSDYDVATLLSQFAEKGKGLIRKSDKHAVCMLVHDSVWQTVGYFRSVPNLFGFEDTLFFHELDKNKIPSAIVGNAWIHHFGSITQSEMKRERGLKDKEGLGHRKNYRLLNQSWVERKFNKVKRTRFRASCLTAELQKANMSLHGIKEKEKDIVWIP